MKKITYILASLLFAVLFAPNQLSAQTNQKNEWLRIQSENGEFSIEFFAEYDFYGDKTGFEISDGNSSYRLSEMRIVNSYRDKTLLSFEAYKISAGKDVANIFFEREGGNGAKSEIKIGESKFKQIVLKKENHYAVRRFYWSKDYLYILTAASRDGETAASKRFFDSLALKTSKTQIEPLSITDSSIKTVSLANLKLSNLEIDPSPPLLPKPDNQAINAAKLENDENTLPLIIFFKPVPSYTDAARQSSEKGIIRFRLTLSENGSVKKVGFLNSLNNGLTRQALFAAIRIKFLPAEKNDEPVSVNKFVEYSFSVR